MPLAAFDLDGTLVDQASAARDWALEFAAAHGLPAAAAASIGDALTARRPKGEVFAELVAAWSLPLSGDEIWAAYRRRMPELVRSSERDKAALRRLRREGWTIGIVSNGMADNQLGKITATGLAELVDGWVISGEVGVRKPEHGIFLALADRLACPLDGWMIGDSLADDIAGGTAVGLKTAWIGSGHTDAAPLATITAASAADAVERILMA